MLATTNRHVGVTREHPSDERNPLLTHQQLRTSLQHRRERHLEEVKLPVIAAHPVRPFLYLSVGRGASGARRDRGSLRAVAR